jgi:hypothetical protein
MSLEFVEEGIQALCRLHEVRGNLQAQLDYLLTTANRCQEHKERAIASGSTEQMEAAGQTFEHLAQLLTAVQGGMVETSGHIERATAQLSSALRELLPPTPPAS